MLWIAEFSLAQDQILRGMKGRIEILYCTCNQSELRKGEACLPLKSAFEIILYIWVQGLANRANEEIWKKLKYCPSFNIRNIRLLSNFITFGQPYYGCPISELLLYMDKGS